MSPQISLILQLVLITAQRPGEVAGMTLDELDEDWETSRDPWWLIPKERSKNGLAHLVRLSPLAVLKIKEARNLAGGSRNVFPSPKHGRPIAVTSLSQAVGRCGHFGLEPFTPHDLRRIASTHITGEHVVTERFFLARVLNHKDQTITGRYDRTAYMPQKREAMRRWGVVLYRIVKGKGL
jgi:integrase